MNLPTRNPIVILESAPGSGAVIVARRFAAIRGGTFRAPHQTISAGGIVTELTRANTLLLDELDRFRPYVLTALREEWQWRQKAKLSVPMLICHLTEGEEKWRHEHYEHDSGTTLRWLMRDVWMHVRNDAVIQLAQTLAASVPPSAWENQCAV